MKRLLAIGSVVCLTAFLLLGCTEDPVPDLFSKPSVTTSYVNVSFGSVKLTCGISNTNFRECGFYYGTKPDLSDKRSVRATMSADGKNAEALLNNLEAGETYYFQAYIDGGRNVATSGIGSFTVSNVMDVYETGFQLTYAETDIHVTVETNLALEVDLGGASWIKETKTKGLETYYKVFHISRNSDPTSRKATIKISSINGEFTKEIPVEQGGGPIDIPDKVFKAYLVENFDKDGDGEIVISELEAIERMDVGCSDKIRSVKGIEYCSNLKYLRCYGPPEGAERGSGILSYVDVTHCPELEEIDLWGNQLEQVDLSGSTKIKYIHLGHNKLSSIDISMLSSLQYLSVEENQLKSLDVSNNTALTEIHCYNNQLTTLDVSNNTALTRFLCYNNPDLTKIWLKSNQTIADFQYDTDVSTIKFKYKDIPEAVDLGLSVKWASFNIGASSPEGYGDYFAWGETETKYDYSWSTYMFNTSDSGLSKYTTVDNKTVLDPEDDVAHVKLGGNWRMPTFTEWTELIFRCTWTWVENYNGTGISGGLVTATNGNSIFLPAAGGRRDTNLVDVGLCLYWSSSLSTNSRIYASALSFDYYLNATRLTDYRFDGFPVRPVSK